MRSTLFTIFLLTAASASAQTSISASITGDIARFSHVESPPDFALYAESALDGEAIGFTLGAGRALGDRWGVAFEFGRSGEIESRQVQEIDPRISARPPLTVLPPPGQPIPGFGLESRTELQVTTMNALLWVKHGAGSRVELSYTGGLAFVRSDTERAFTISDPRLLAIWALPATTRYVEHRAAAVVGMDAAIAFTDHTALTAGIRATAIEVSGTPGWLLRPGVGVRWTF